jgi:hypothetical protein
MNTLNGKARFLKSFLLYVSGYANADQQARQAVHCGQNVFGSFVVSLLVTTRVPTQGKAKPPETPK